MGQAHLWRLAAAALGAAVASTATILIIGQTTPVAQAATPANTVGAAAGISQWGTVRTVDYHRTGSADTHSLIAIVELYDGRRFVHTVSSGVRRLPAPGEVWNIEGDTPPSGWKPRK